MGASSRARAVDASAAATITDMAASDGGSFAEGVSLPEASALLADAPLVAIAGSSTFAAVAGAAVCSARPMTVPGPAGSYEAVGAVGLTGSTERVEVLQECNTAAEETQTSVKVLLFPRKPDMLQNSAIGDVPCVTDVPWVGSADLVEDGGASPFDDTAAVLALSSVGGAGQSACFSRDYEREPTPADRAATQELPDSKEAATDVEPVVGAELARAVGPHNVHEPPPAYEAAVNTPAHWDQATAYGDLVVGAEFAPALETRGFRIRLFWPESG